MVRPLVCRRAAAGAMLAGWLAGSACMQAENLLGNSREPALYLVLTRPDPSQAVPDSALYGLLVTAASPIASEYRNPESLVLTRQSDGTTYGWRSLSRNGPVPNMSRELTLGADGNLQLPWSASVLGAGRESLSEGDAYHLQLVSGDRTVTGTTHVPSVPTITIRSDASGTTIHWARAIHAAAYFVIVDTDNPGALVTTDTSYALLLNRPLDQRPSPPRIHVIAMDANLAMYVNDTTASSAGLEGALGVFGGTSRAMADLPNAITAQASPGAIGASTQKRAPSTARGLLVSPSPRARF